MTDGGSGSGFSWGLTPGGPGKVPKGQDAAGQGPEGQDPDPFPELETTQRIEHLPPEPTTALHPPSEPTPDPAPTEPAELLIAAAAFAAAEAPPGSPSAVAEPGGALDALFGDEQFEQYEEGLVPAQGPVARRPKPRGTRAAASAGVSHMQKTAISVAGGLVAVLALVALFFLGTRLPHLLDAGAAVSPTPTPTRTSTPTPTSTVLPVGPVAAGVHGWNELLGGECLDPYASPWAEKFTVVDCAAAHPAQMVFRGTFDPATTPTFPGAAALQTQLSLLCAAPGVLNLAVAGQYSDAQVQGSYPVTEKQWAAGQHDYFCFISRSSGQPLIGSLAIPKPAAAAP